MTRLAYVALILVTHCNKQPATSASQAAPPKSAVVAFHDVMAPVWHASDEAAKQSGACEIATSLQSLSRKMQAEPAPSGAKGGYVPLTVELEAAATKLVSSCTGSDRVGVKGAFSGVHDAYHAVQACIE